MAENKEETDRLPLILVVDDNQQNLELIQAYLEDIECETVGRPRWDRGPGDGGQEQARPDPAGRHDAQDERIRGLPEAQERSRRPANIPVIMVTALNEFGDIERGIDSGTDDFVSKPINQLELLTRIRTMLKLKHLTDRLQRTMAYLSEVEKHTQTDDVGSADQRGDLSRRTPDRPATHDPRLDCSR